MIDGPRLSIIIPVFNAAPFLRGCLDSILAQDTQKVEVILIDDGSSDDSGAICDDYSESYPNIVTIHQENKGVSRARNAGIERATGTWLSFVDPDDYISKDYVSSFYSLIKHTDLIFFSLSITSSDGKIKDKIMNDAVYSGINEMQSGIYRMMFNEQKCEFFAFTVNKFFKADIIHKHDIRFIPNLTFREDELFTLEYCSHISTFTSSASCLYVYRIDIQGSLSHTPKKVEELFSYYDHALTWFDKFTDTQLKSAEYNRLLHFLINAYEPNMIREHSIGLLNRISNLIKTRSEYLKHLRKTRLLKVVVSFPPLFSFPILRFILHWIYRKNLTNSSQESIQDPLW